MPKEWLLSGHNTQESVALTYPLMASMMEFTLTDSVNWFMNQMLTDMPGFDLQLAPIAIVQGWVYLNLNYSVRNAAITPFDPASVGVPDEFIAQHPEFTQPPVKLSLVNTLKFLKRLNHFYHWAIQFYANVLPGYDEITRNLYWRLRNSPDDVDLAWEALSPETGVRGLEVSHAHQTISILLLLLDSLVRNQAPQLLGLFVGNATTTSLMGQRIWNLRTIALQCGPEVCALLRKGITDLSAYKTIAAAQPFLKGLQAFLLDYGHRGFRYELDFTSERLADYPQQIMIAVAAQLDEQDSPAQRAMATRQLAEKSLVAMFPPKRAVWQRLLNWSQKLIACRESSKSYLALHQALFGICMKSLSRAYHPNSSADMLLFYQKPEFDLFLKSQGETKPPLDILNRRMTEYELHQNQPPPPDLIWFDPGTHHWRPALDESTMPRQVIPASFQGIPASGGAGIVEGIAMVTNDPLEAGRRLLEIHDPIILVTRLTDPAWSSLFIRLTGVITELGGVISHAAIVARENGLPAVVGVAEATIWIRDGQKLRLDGNTGTIEILN